MQHEMPKSFSDINKLLLKSSGPVMALLIILAGISVKSYLGWSLEDVLIFCSMIFFRSFVEWFFHRHVWHAKPVIFRGRYYQNPVAVMHANHHKNPFDVNGLLFGGRGVIVVFFVMAGGVFLIFKSLSVALDISVSFMIILIMHEWVHLLCHSNVNPESRFLSGIIYNHRYHHYENPMVCFGVSSLLADRLFKTMPASRGL